MTAFDYVIVGAGAAGISAVEGIRKHDRAGSIMVISQERDAAYSRPLLTHFLAGKISAENLHFRPDGFLVQNNVTVMFERKALGVSSESKEVRLDNGESIRYGRLLIATGSHPIKPDIPGIELEGVFLFHDRADAQAVLDYLPGKRKVMILGGGPVGVGVAQALRARGMEVTMVISSGRVLSQLVDDEGSEVVKERIERSGTKVMPNTSVVEIIGEGKVAGVRVEDGSVWETDMVIISKGVEPNMEMMSGTSVQMDRGIVVNGHMCTNIPEIYAAGDVARTDNLVLGGKGNYAIWPNAMEQGRIAGENMAGGSVEYAGAMALNSVNVFGLPLMVMGTVRPRDRNGISFMRRGVGENYKCLVLKEERLIGALLIGRIGNAGVYSMLIRRKTSVADFRNVLLADDFDRGKLIDLGLLKADELSG